MQEILSYFKGGIPIVKKQMLTIAILVMMVFAGQTINSVDLSKRIGVSFGFPYLGVKYANSQGMITEFRLNFDGGVGIIGGRVYINFLNKEDFITYFGFECGYIFFNDVEDLKGHGYLGSMFIGGEYFFGKNLSLGGDFGPALISLYSDVDNETATVNGLEWIINLSVNYYFE